MGEKNFDLLQTKEIEEILNGDRGTFPYLSGQSILGKGKKFGAVMPKEVGMKSRWQLMEKLLQEMARLDKTEVFLADLVSKVALKDRIENAKDANFEINPYEKVSTEQIYRSLRHDALADLNNQLFFSGYKLFDHGSFIEIIYLTETPKIEVPKNIITNDFVQNVLDNGEKDLKNGDFASVVTKSKTILESIFRQILDGAGKSYSKSPNLKEYQSKVSELLNMKYSDDWNSRVRNMVSSLNKLVDSISELRNKDSDAHGRTKIVNIDAAEAELLLNTSISLAIYYLRVADRK